MMIGLKKLSTWKVSKATMLKRHLKLKWVQWLKILISYNYMMIKKVKKTFKPQLQLILPKRVVLLSWALLILEIKILSLSEIFSWESFTPFLIEITIELELHLLSPLIKLRHKIKQNHRKIQIQPKQLKLFLQNQNLLKKVKLKNLMLKKERQHHLLQLRKKRRRLQL